MAILNVFAIRLASCFFSVITLKSPAMKISLEWWTRQRPCVPRILVLAALLIFSCTSLVAQDPKDAEAYFNLGVEQATAADKATDRKAHIEAAINSFKAASDSGMRFCAQRPQVPMRSRAHSAASFCAITAASSNFPSNR